MGLGLHLAEQHASIVELQREPDGVVCVRSEGVCALPAGAIESGQIRREAEVIQAVHDLLTRCGVICPRVTLDLPARSVLLRRLHQPAQARPRDWHEAARREAAALLQLESRDVAVDCVPAMAGLSLAAVGHEDREIIVVAARHDRVRERLSIADALGLEPVVVEPAHHAAQRTLRVWLEGAHVAPVGRLPLLIEIDNRTTRLTVPGESDSLIEREHQGQGPHPSELVQTIEHFQAAWPTLRPDALVVAGWVPDPSWRQELERRCGKPVHLMAAWGGLQRVPRPATPDPMGSAGDDLWRHGWVACGLALRSLAP